MKSRFRCICIRLIAITLDFSSISSPKNKLDKHTCPLLPLSRDNRRLIGQGTSLWHAAKTRTSMEPRRTQCSKKKEDWNKLIVWRSNGDGSLPSRRRETLLANGTMIQHAYSKHVKTVNLLISILSILKNKIIVRPASRFVYYLSYPIREYPRIKTDCVRSIAKGYRNKYRIIETY